MVPMPRGSVVPTVGGPAVVPMSLGSTVGGPLEVKARVSVPGRGVNGVGGATVYAGSRFRRSVKERLGRVEKSDDIKATTNKVNVWRLNVFLLFSCLLGIRDFAAVAPFTICC